MTDDQILERLGLTDVDEVSRIALITQVNNVVDMRLLGTITELLSDDQLAQFKQIQEDNGDEAVWKWLSEQLIDLDELRQGILTDYLRERAARA